MANLIFFGGIGEIGGNKILLENEGTQIFLDFGKNFERERKYYDAPYLEPREEDHLLNLGILPKIDGLYKKDKNQPAISGIVLSHPHVDHTDYIRYLKDEIPIFCGETTRDIIVSREFSGRPAPKDYAVAKYTKTAGQEVFKEFKTFRTGDVVTIGSIKVDPVHVDHSIPGAYGLIINTEAGGIVYTGDFRLHGTRNDMTEDFLEKAKSAKPRALIIEGTNIVSGNISSEKEVKEKVGCLVSQSPGLVMASFSPVDIDRLRTFYEVAKETGRKLAISTKQAFLIKNLAADPNLSLFDLTDPDILIFAREKKAPPFWEQNLINTYGNVIESVDVCDIQNDVILSASFYDMNEMYKICPSPGAIFILSQSEPFNEEMEIDYKKLLNWLEHYGIPLYNIHTSGHATPIDLKSAISAIAPEKVFLIHTERPKLYQHYLRDLKIKTISPEPEIKYSL